MSYKVAKDCFKENITLTGGSQVDPVSFNHFNGLFQLTQQLERDLSDLRDRLARLERR